MIKVDKERFEEIRGHLEAFKYNTLQDVYVLIHHLFQFDIGIDEFVGYIDEVKRDRVGHQDALESGGVPITNCPKCGKAAYIYMVNSKKCDQIGGDYKTQIKCIDQYLCGYDGFSPATVYEWAKEMNLMIEGAIENQKPCGDCGGDK